MPRLSYGIGSKALGIIWGPCALAVVIVGTSVSWWWALAPICVGMLIHTVLRWLYAKDHRIFAKYLRYSSLSNFYHPHVREKLPSSFERPVKVGRGLRY